MTPALRIRLFTGEDGKAYATVIAAGNNEPIFTSEGHANGSDVRELVDRYFPDAELDDEL